MKERKRWRSARESDYIRAQGGGGGGERGTEIRCCVKYNTYFTTEIPIPSTRSEIHRGAIKLNELPGGSFLSLGRFFSNRCIRLCRNGFLVASLCIINIYVSLTNLFINATHFDLFAHVDFIHRRASSRRR